MKLIKIEKNVPIPSSGLDKSNLPFDKMEIGDSFIIDSNLAKNKQTTRQLLYNA